MIEAGMPPIALHAPTGSILFELPGKKLNRDSVLSDVAKIAGVYLYMRTEDSRGGPRRLLRSEALGRDSMVHAVRRLNERGTAVKMTSPQNNPRLFTALSAYYTKSTGAGLGHLVARVRFTPEDGKIRRALSDARAEFDASFDKFQISTPDDEPYELELEEYDRVFDSEFTVVSPESAILAGMDGADYLNMDMLGSEDRGLDISKNNAELPELAKHVAFAYHQLLQQSADVCPSRPKSEDIVANMLGASGMVELTSAWSAGMECSSPLKCGQLVLNSLTYSGTGN